MKKQKQTHLDAKAKAHAADGRFPARTNLELKQVAEEDGQVGRAGLGEERRGKVR